jgi:hypothetical protein
MSLLKKIINMCFTETSLLSVSDIISIIGLFINSILAIWVVKTLQNNLANKRYLKDHLIEEIKELRIEYRIFLNDLNTGKLKPKQITPWFKLMNIKVQDTMELLTNKYKIDNSILNPYQIELRNIVTEQKEFNENYKDNKLISLKESSRRELIKFQQENNSKFNSLILEINEK